MALTTGREKGFALDNGRGEPAIAMATDWLMVLVPSMSPSSARKVEV